MNILFLAYNINIHSRTGDAIHVRELALNIVELGNKVALVVGSNVDSEENISSLTKNPNIDVKYVKESKLKYPRSKDVSILSLCRDIVKNNSFDIVYERNFSCRIGVILSKILRIPLVVEINGLVDEEAEMQGRHVSPIKKIVGKRLRRFFFTQAQKIVAVTVGIKDELINSYKIPSEKIVVVANGANTNIFKPMNQKEVKAELGLDEEYHYICFVGNLAPWQGVEYLIAAAPKVIEMLPNTKFLIVGDGIICGQLKNLVNKSGFADYFIFIGKISYELVPKYINASDVCVVPKKIIKSGYSPLKLYEYMACGRAVIATRTQGFEILEDDYAGLLVDPSNPGDFSNEIAMLIQNNEKRKKMGQNGLKLVNEQFSWNVTAKKIVDLCKNAI